MKKISLTKQLIYITALIIGIIFIALGIILPKKLLPIYEENIYNKLKQPLVFIKNNENIDKFTMHLDTDISYIYIANNKVFTSYNMFDIMPSFDEKIINYLTKDYGKFLFKNKLYYYYKTNINNSIIISLTNDKYINNMKNDILYTILLITGISFTICSLILILWSNNLVNKIVILKKKIDNIDNDTKININHTFIDEIYSLNESIENMKEYLKNNEMYKNQTYQSISHDFKTPITVIKSYIEASEDGIETNEKSLAIIKEEITKLENKVHSLLYLNKLNYINDKTINLKTQTNVKDVINTSIEKFRLIRPELNYIIESDNKDLFRGTSDMWETIIDNLLNNFMRYAKKEIKISIKNKKITLYNDGDNIDEKILNNIFTPYEKGLNGMFGLGLSIVKKSLRLLNYDINVNNVKSGVIFTIK